MLMIRLARYGAKKKPFYHVVAIDKRCARNAICKEKLGFYHPLEKYLQLNLSRVHYWLSSGAQCSETVETLLKKYEQGKLKPPHTPKAFQSKRKNATQSTDNASTPTEDTAKAVDATEQAPTEGVTKSDATASTDTVNDASETASTTIQSTDGSSDTPDSNQKQSATEKASTSESSSATASPVSSTQNTDDKNV